MYFAYGFAIGLNVALCFVVALDSYSKDTIPVPQLQEWKCDSTYTPKEGSIEVCVRKLNKEKE